MVPTILPKDPLTLGNRSKVQYLTFSELDYVANQIEENNKCSNMVANILPADPRTSTPP